MNGLGRVTVVDKLAATIRQGNMSLRLGTSGRGVYPKWEWQLFNSAGEYVEPIRWDVGQRYMALYGRDALAGGFGWGLKGINRDRVKVQKPDWTIVEGGERVVNLTREQYQELRADVSQILEADNRPIEWDDVLPPRGL